MIEIWCLLYLARFFTFANAQLPPHEETCDPEFYGRPKNQDCRDALARLPDWAMTFSHDEGWEPVREFIQAGGQARIPSPDNGENNVQTPFMLTNGKDLESRDDSTSEDDLRTDHRPGTCTVVIVIPHDGYFADTMLVETRKLNAKADSLRTKCVENQGSGGLYHGVQQWRGYDLEEFPNIYIYGPDSDAERYLDYMYNCITDADGNDLCKTTEHSEENDSDWIKFIQDVQLPESQDPVPKGSKRACRGSCFDLDDCDIDSDCLCASTKGILLSSTWGKHSCMHIAGTAIALAAAAIHPAGICRGRCLLEENGTVKIAQTANATGSIDIPLANLTDHLNASSAFSPSPANRSSLADIDDYDPSRIPPGVSLPTIPPQNPPALICPCNCTYVSAACCLSRVVWEEPSMQIRMDAPPANASVVCDSGSGKWIPKPTASRDSKEDNRDFVELGSVKWNSSASSSVKIP